MGKYIDFKRVKEAAPITAVLDAYKLSKGLKHAGNQLRGPCPLHDGTNKRAFVVTPKEDLWYCHGDCKAGGDQIALVAKLQGVSMRDAALDIAERFNLRDPPKEAKAERDQAPSEGLKPLSYLQSDHELIVKLGVGSATCEHYEAGYAPKGIMRGRLAFPLHSPNGDLVAYCGRAVKEGQSPKLIYPKDFDPASVLVNAHRITETDSVTLVRDPLDILLTYEDGRENVVALLGDVITLPQLEMLVSFIRENGIEYLDC